jgi:two-component system sensor histidine kinase AlgZ
MSSIRQTSRPTATLPDFRNLGALLRILILVNAAAIVAAILKTSSLAEVWGALLGISAVLQPILLASLIALAALSPFLSKLKYREAVLAILALEAVAVLAVAALFGDNIEIGRAMLFTLLSTIVLLFYFDLRSRALSPAISEARLQALQARIRPHFLFNSINTVLSLIRVDPMRAERALEDLADLFRVAMRENRELSPLKRELELCQHYLNLEQLRLGERLKVEWHVDNMPEDALIPPLVLQPLLENAIYHGIEPASEPGAINLHVYQKRGQIHAVLKNPYNKEGRHHSGNKMALANISERLALHFDAEANLRTTVTEQSYQVHITIPYLRTSGSAS